MKNLGLAVGAVAAVGLGISLSMRAPSSAPQTTPVLDGGRTSVNQRQIMPSLDGGGFEFDGPRMVVNRYRIVPSPDGGGFVFVLWDGGQ